MHLIPCCAYFDYKPQPGCNNPNPCHRERRQAIPLCGEAQAKSKDPENVRDTILLQGILTNCSGLLPGIKARAFMLRSGAEALFTRPLTYQNSSLSY